MGRLILLTAGLLMLSAISLVTSRYQARELFVELERSNAQEREIDVEWRRLQLERADLARNARVDQLAGSQLKMIPVVPERTLYVNLPELTEAGQAQAAGGGHAQ
ncbi:cell division protein FtsL [Orrella sp. JC864]|uniref:cell division protein FtsL n=1 Tax=Orrella sp. JC864 TaxID=3120298 RepID=UPI0012BB5A86